MILTVANMKGGTGKTTTVAFLAHALAERGRAVVALDADPQGSLTRWAKYAAWSLPVERWTAGRAAQLAAAGWDAVIDTPPTSAERDHVWRAVRESTHVLVPIAPTPAEYDRAGEVRKLITEAQAVGGPTITAAALLVRTVAGAASTGVYRDILTEDGWRVLRATVGRREVFAQAFAGPIVRAVNTSYGDAAAELVPSPTPVEG